MDVESRNHDGPKELPHLIRNFRLVNNLRLKRFAGNHYPGSRWTHVGLGSV
jgi:hypothetical protein